MTDYSLVEDTFFESFRGKYIRALITAEDEQTAKEAAYDSTATPSSVIGRIEGGVEGPVSANFTPDGRPGYMAQYWFGLDDLKKTGKQTVIIGVFQALAATILVDAALLAVHLLMPDKLSVSQLITLGAIATATAPAATLMVVRQYKAKGPLTDLLLPIVALDDAVGLIVFAVSFGIA